LEVVNAFRGKRERRGCRCVGTHINGGEAMPNKGIALVCRRVDRSGDVRDIKRVNYKRSRALGRSTIFAHVGSEVPQASRGARSCVSALSSRSSNRSGVIAFSTPVVVLGYRGIVGHQWSTTGQPAFGADKMKWTEPTARPCGTGDL